MVQLQHLGWQDIMLLVGRKHLVSQFCFFVVFPTGLQGCIFSEWSIIFSRLSLLRRAHKYRSNGHWVTELEKYSWHCVFIMHWSWYWNREGSSESWLCRVGWDETGWVGNSRNLFGKIWVLNCARNTAPVFMHVYWWNVGHSNSSCKSYQNVRS